MRRLVKFSDLRPKSQFNTPFTDLSNAASRRDQTALHAEPRQQRQRKNLEIPARFIQPLLWLRPIKRATTRSARQHKDRAMQSNHLRLYFGPEDETATLRRDETSTVKVPLGEILPLLADAVNSKRTWLRDFTDDEVTISSDLFEVINAYQHFRRPSA
jgi:hypothetical protein